MVPGSEQIAAFTSISQRVIIIGESIQECAKILDNLISASPLFNIDEVRLKTLASIKKLAKELEEINQKMDTVQMQYNQIGEQFFNGELYDRWVDNLINMALSTNNYPYPIWLELNEEDQRFWYNRTGIGTGALVEADVKSLEDELRAFIKSHVDAARKKLQQESKDTQRLLDTVSNTAASNKWILQEARIKALYSQLNVALIETRRQHLNLTGFAYFCAWVMNLLGWDEESTIKKQMEKLKASKLDDIAAMTLDDKAQNALNRAKQVWRPEEIRQEGQRWAEQALSDVTALRNGEMVASATNLDYDKKTPYGKVVFEDESEDNDQDRKHLSQKIDPVL